MNKDAEQKIPPLTPAQRRQKKALLETFRIQVAELTIQVAGLEEAIKQGLPEKKAKAQLLHIKSELETLERNEEITEKQIKERK